MRRLALLPVLLALAATWFGVSAASAGAVIRLDGSANVALTVTAANNSIPPVGTIGIRTWTFTPQCATGGCVTTLVRPHLTSTAATTYNLAPVGFGYRYFGQTTFTADCFNVQTGAVTVAGGSTQTETINLFVEDFQNGNAGGIHGTFTLTGTPNALGRAHGCQPSSASATFAGVIVPPPIVTVVMNERFLGAVVGAQATITGGDTATITRNAQAVPLIGKVCVVAYWHVEAQVRVPESVMIAWFQAGDSDAEFNPQTTPGWESHDSPIDPSTLITNQIVANDADHYYCQQQGFVSARVIGGDQSGFPLLLRGGGISGANPITAVSHILAVQLFSPSGALIQTVQTAPTNVVKHVFAQFATTTCQVRLYTSASCSEGVG